MKVKYVLFVITILCFGMSSTFLTTVELRAQEKIKIGTAAPGGYYYTVSAAISECLNKYHTFPNLRSLPWYSLMIPMSSSLEKSGHRVSVTQISE